MEEASAMTPPKSPDDEPLDPRLERELKRKLVQIQRQTERGWQDLSFWRWLWERVTLSARRSGRS
jgi:hypothetical protein